MQVNRIDHLVLTVADIDSTVNFYETVLGMRKIEFAGGRIALAFGRQKINLHRLGAEFEPHAGRVQAGSADLCFIVDDPLDEALQQLRKLGVEVIEGPVARSGAVGPLQSLYFNDPDGNLIEISNYATDRSAADQPGNR